MSKSDRNFLLHILDETEYLLRNSQDLNKNDFFKNDTLKLAFIRSLEVIGEAVKNLSNSLREKYHQIAWKMLAGMRDKLIHNYFGVDYDIV
jgi:uncharacterized protein with HEPN domain